jgi:hypothetical protein
MSEIDSLFSFFARRGEGRQSKIGMTKQQDVDKKKGGDRKKTRLSWWSDEIVTE